MKSMLVFCSSVLSCKSFLRRDVTEDFLCHEAQRLRMAAQEKAEAEKILMVKRAEGEAESKYLSGVGVARQRQVRTFFSQNG